MRDAVPHLEADGHEAQARRLLRLLRQAGVLPSETVQLPATWRSVGRGRRTVRAAV